MGKMYEKNKILFIGGTGYVGKFIVEASLKAGHPTFLLVRESTIADPVKGKLVKKFKDSGVILFIGDIYDEEKLVKAIRQVDVVISTIGHGQLLDQVNIIRAIKHAGNIKRFFPSDFGNNVDCTYNGLEPAKSIYETKVQFRRIIEAEGIPYTIVHAFLLLGWFIPTLLGEDRVIIPGDGNERAVFIKEEDVGTYTIKAVDDPRTLNKILDIRPEGNTYSFNELVSLWEKKKKKKESLGKIYISEEDVMKNIPEEASILQVVTWALDRQTQSDPIDPSFVVEASELYPDVEYTTVDEYLDQLV